MLKLFKYLKKKDYIYIVISIVFILIQVWLNLMIPEYTGVIIKIATDSTNSHVLADIIQPGGIMLLATLGSAASAVITGYLIANVAASYSRETRSVVYNKILSFSDREMHKFSTPSLITRTTNDITQTQMLISMGVQVMIQAPLMAVFAISKILNKGWEWSLVTLIAVFILVIIILIIIKITLPKFKEIQDATDDLNQVTREGLTGSSIVRAYNAESYQEGKFEVINDDLAGKELFTRRVFSFMSPVMMLVMNGLILAIHLIAAVMIRNNGVANVGFELPDITMFVQYSMQVVMSFIMLTMILFIYPRASVSAKRINEVIGTKSTIVDGFGNTKYSSIGTVEFRDVSFRYPDAEEYVIKDISFIIKQGQTAAFIGSTGSGKSSLINLIPRFYDVSSGEVFVDGINVKEYKLSTLNKKVAYVPQSAVLFKGTINSNIDFGETTESINLEVVKKAIDIAQGKEFVESMEDTYDGHISQSGTNVSGGQKQRLAIARAIARQPEIIIFDDSFSALDYRTDKDLRETLKRETKAMTKLIVAQRIGTIIDADQIFVLDKGLIVGTGTHRELLKSCEVYREIALSQLSEEELENETK